MVPKQPGTLAVLLPALLVACLGRSNANIAPDPMLLEMQGIARSEGLSKEEKVRRLRQYLTKGVESTGVMRWIAQVDPPSAQALGIELFRDPRTSREEKLHVGKELLRLEAPAFIDEYAPFLLEAVLTGGEKEFMAERPMHRISAVGEYVFIASDFDGMASKQFEKLKDKRVIPILIRCLGAPDHVYPVDQGDHIHGEPGKPTGRNTQRQQIPVALARLKAVEAIPALKQTLFTHHDYYGRYNAAYALGFLGDDAVAREAEAFLRQNEEKDHNRLIFFAFGKGLLERGDDRGVEFMSFRYSYYSDRDDISMALYMARERLPVMKPVRSPKAETFYREALERKSLSDLFLFDETKVKVPDHLMRVTPDRKSTVPVKTPAEALDWGKDQIIAAYKDIAEGITANRLKGLSGHLATIGKNTKNEQIRAISEQALRALGE